MIIGKERSTYERKDTLTGEERIIVSGTEYVTPRQIASLAGGGTPPVSDMFWTAPQIHVCQDGGTQAKYMHIDHPMFGQDGVECVLMNRRRATGQTWETFVEQFPRRSGWCVADNWRRRAMLGEALDTSVPHHFTFTGQDTPVSTLAAFVKKYYTFPDTPADQSPSVDMSAYGGTFHFGWMASDSDLLEPSYFRYRKKMGVAMRRSRADGGMEYSQVTAIYMCIHPDKKGMSVGTM